MIKNKLPLILHILAWIIVILMPLYIAYTYGEDEFLLKRLYSNITIYGLVFYLNYLYLLPNFFFQKKKIVYFAAIAVLTIIICVLMWYINDHIFFNDRKPPEFNEEINKLFKDKLGPKPPVKEFQILNYFYTTILILGFSLGLKLAEKASVDEKKRKELEKEKINSELAFLKNQISPHFFFNTLNNIYSLIKVDSNDAQESVLNLSKLMRYLLYETEKGETKLQEEINFLNNYVDLMKLRLNPKVEVTTDFPDKFTNHTIPPLLFIPFIENAFKHGISYHHKSFIHFKLQVDEDIVVFTSENTISPSNEQEEVKSSGIGLENVKKRLNLLFPNSHQLNIDQQNNIFTVQLTLNLS